MAQLPNMKHEAFCRALMEGRSASAAYVAAGFKPSTANAARLRATEAIQCRLAELSAEAAAKHEITIEGILEELNVAIELATKRGMPNALINAALAKSRLGGLLIDRSKVEITNDDRYNLLDDCKTPEAISRRLADDELNGLVNFRWLPIDEDDRAYLASIWLECFQRVREFVVSVEARPLNTAERPMISVAKPPFPNGR
jgi:hypothetical protein